MGLIFCQKKKISTLKKRFETASASHPFVKVYEKQCKFCFVFAKFHMFSQVWYPFYCLIIFARIMPIMLTVE